MASNEPKPPQGETTRFENRNLEASETLNQAAQDIVEGTSLPAPSEASPSSTTIFTNDGVKAKTINQAGRSIYTQSAHTEGGGTASVVNITGAPGGGVNLALRHGEVTAAASSVRLMITFGSAGSSPIVQWEADVLGTVQTTFTMPYDGTMLTLVVRALDCLQEPSYPHAATDAQRQQFSFPVADQAKLVELGLWAHSRISPDAHRIVGRSLYTTLTADPAAARALATVRDHATTTGRPVNLSLRFPPDAVELAALPWELLWADEAPPLLLSRGQLADCARYLALTQALPPLERRTEPLRILAISPQAGIPGSIRDEERTARRTALQPLIDAGQAVMEEVSPATRAAVVDAVQRFQPHIIHYYGHGEYLGGKGVLYLDNGAGGSKATAADRLMTLFGRARLVVLHACQGAMVSTDPSAGLLTGIAPALSAAGVPVVIGMQLKIRINAATRASEIIYRTLASGRSVQEAVSHARQALYVEEDDQAAWYVPTLYIRHAETGPVYV